MGSKEETHQVREAVKDDCHQIMEFIKMIARHENMEDAVKTDVKTLIRDGFTENDPPSFKCLVSHDANNQLSGYLIYYYTYSTWEGRCIFILNIFVDAPFRRMGIGKKFITKLAQIAYAENMARIDLFILECNQLSIDFHQSLGAVNLSNKLASNSFRFNKNSIQQLAGKTMESKKEAHQVREAVEDDCHQIIELIKMFARYVKMEDAVKIDAETLIRDGFTENEPPSFKCIVSHDVNNQLSGYLIYYYTYSPWEGRCIYMEEIFVDPQFRKMGIGTKMITKLAQIAYAENIVRIDFLILDWNQLSIDFHQSLGAVSLTEEHKRLAFRFNKKSIQQSAKN
ncbi:spermidine/spermine N(1)-acetyltransferase-like protein 1 [Tetranychus urticae]|uniref:N-acetyltransferase domain-containing protein n=1 Tax=Tetranychus urticae TaxID=32264 RepID=A0A158P5A8_TETUR|nr:spermidine/spermine N(1)-acetyltransferase-like protein 1 [Tetranychus urticae]